MTEQEKRGKRFKVKPRYPYPSAQMIAEGGCEGECEACEGKMVCWKNYFEEQGKREKAIGEMVLDGAECSHIAEWWNCKHCKYSPCGARRTCENLVDKDYRKADEVRKETIKEFISFVKNVIDNYKPTVTETDSGIRTYHYLTDYALFDIIKEKYKKEVEE